MTAGSPPAGACRNRVPVVALLTGNTISLAGSAAALVAIPWFVLQTTHSPAKAGVTGFFITLATVVAAFFGGGIVDRLGFKRTSIAADLASGLAVALIPLLYVTVGLQYWELLVLVFVGNLLDAPGNTARDALIPELTQAAGMTLEQAGAAIQAVERGARMVGAPLAGLLIAVAGTQNVLWFDAATFAVSAALVALAVPRPPARAEADLGRSYWGELRAGVAFILRDDLLLAVTILIVITNFLDAPASGVLYPVYINQFFGSALYLGLLISAGGAGSVIGAIAFALWGHRLPRRALFFGCFLLATTRLWAMALVPPFWLIIVFSLFAGMASGPINPILSTMEYERIPLDYRGRILGTITATAWMAMPLGVLLGGYALQAVDPRVVLVILACLYDATLVGFLFNPALRRMNQRPRAPAKTQPA
jgi:predicted MFS family arabinose efflux permease